MQMEKTPYLLFFSKSCKLSVAALQQLCRTPLCPQVKLINVVPVAEFRKRYPSLAFIKSVPIVIDTTDGSKHEKFQVLNWIREKTKELGASVEEDAPFLPGMVELVEGEVGKGIVSDTYSYITEDIVDNLRESDVGMNIGHSYAGLELAYSGPPSIDRPPAPDGRRPIGLNSGGGAVKSAKQTEIDRRMEALMERRNAEVPQAPVRIGGSAMPHPSMMRRPGMR